MAMDLVLTKRCRHPPRSTCSPPPAARRSRATFAASLADAASRTAATTPTGTCLATASISPLDSACLPPAPPLLGDGHDAWVLEVARRSVNLRQSMNTGESSLLMHPMPTE
uniref:Uncharacterized protein n=1 Tax=Setaria viridis TaxID=4556 RepID=A0A4U6TPJ4_SETVI|nr:hypothetical protein SEVIR_8G044100v2 [Setaria viridis]